MDTDVQALQPLGKLPEQVSDSVRILRGGGVVAIPTDTLYGLAADPFNDQAIRTLFRVKRRRDSEPIPLLLASADDIDRYATNVPPAARALAEALWPGPLTLVVQRAGNVPDAVTGGTANVGLRVPDSWVPRAIARELGAAITGTSANISGSPPATTAEAVRAQLGDDVDLVVDGGQTPGVASTVVQVDKDGPRILRQGAISARAVEESCGIAVQGGAERRD